MREAEWGGDRRGAGPSSGTQSLPKPIASSLCAETPQIIVDRFVGGQVAPTGGWDGWKRTLPHNEFQGDERCPSISFDFFMAWDSGSDPKVCLNNCATADMHEMS